MKNRKSILISAAAVGAIALWLFSSAFLTRGNIDGEIHEIERGPLQVWTSYEGTIQSRTVRGISSQLGGSATIVELIPEGAEVTTGTPLVKLDASNYERELIRVERERALARAEFESLTKARIPLESNEMEIRMLQAQSELQDAEDALADLHELIEEDLLPEYDAVQQEKKNKILRTTFENIKNQMELTREFLHPSMIDRAKAQLESAEREWEMARKQMEFSTIEAPSDGVVVYKPMPISSEFRTVRVGDTVYKNQVFITLPDMDDLIVRVDVPEYELTLAQAGRPVSVQPIAYPNLKLSGIIESVGSMAQSRPNRPGNQKYFQVTVRLDETRTELRSGMSARIRVLSYDEPDAVLLPRRAVFWEDNEPHCMVMRGSKQQKEQLVLGVAGVRNYAVQKGLDAGQRVVIP